MTQLNRNVYYVISTDNSTEMTIAVDSTTFSEYTSGGTATQVAYGNYDDEIELHGFILDTNPSQVLV